MALSTIPTRALSEQGINFRNLIINGDMSIAQRGTSETGITNATSFVIDRFQMQNNSAYTSNVEQETLTSGGAFESGFRKALKVTWTTASDNSTANYSLTNYAIEKQDMNHLLQGTSNAKNIVISFWVKSSVTGNHALTMQNYAASRRSNVLSYTINSADTWEYKTIATSVDTTASTQSDNGKGIFLRFAHAAGSNFEESTSTGGWVTADSFGFTGATYPAETTNATWHLTGLQIEVGTSASDFEFLPYDVNYQRCLRYYRQMTPNSPTQTDFANYGWVATESSVVCVSLPLHPSMRSTPSATVTGAVSIDDHYRATRTQSTAHISVNGTANGNSVVLLLNYFSGMSVGNVGQFNSVNTYILKLDSEL